MNEHEALEIILELASGNMLNDYEEDPELRQEANRQNQAYLIVEDLAKNLEHK